jgi:hypothetical protein
MRLLLNKGAILSLAPLYRIANLFCLQPVDILLFLAVFLKTGLKQVSLRILTHMTENQ